MCTSKNNRKTMKNLLTIILLTTLTGITPVVAQNEIKEQLIVPLSDPNKPGSLDVNLINGSIKVIGYSGKEVVIEAIAASTQHSGGYTKERTKDGNDNLNINLNLNRGDDPKLSEGMKRINTRGSFDIVAEEENNVVKLTHRLAARNVNFTIKVPQKFNLKLRSLNNKIVVEGVSGEIEANSVNSPIELTNISGSAIAHTTNGSLIATFREVNNNTPMAFSTLNGRVDVTFPASVKANVKVKSDRGDVFSDFDIDIDKKQPQTTRSAQAGMYRVSIEDWVYGKINGGGPEVMMKSMMGSIYIRKAK
jgi:hypothetical protein